MSRCLSVLLAVAIGVLCATSPGCSGSSAPEVDAGADVGLDAVADGGQDAGGDPGRDAGPDQDAGPGDDGGPGEDAGADVGLDAEGDAGVAPDGTGPLDGADAGADAGHDAGADTGSDVGPDEGPDAGADQDDPVQDIRFMVLSDTHIKDDETIDERFRGVVSGINAGDFGAIDFLIITGDVVNYVFGDWSEENPVRTDNRIEKTDGMLSELEVPYYYVLGNHDYKVGRGRDSSFDAVFTEEEILDMEQVWMDTVSVPPFYSFMHRGWKMIALSSMRGIPNQVHFDPEQLTWLEAELEPGVPTMLFFHHAMQTDHPRIWCGPVGLVRRLVEPRFYDLLEAHKQDIKAIFVGHGHLWVTDTLFEVIQVNETAGFEEPLIGSTPHHIVEGNSQAEVQITRGY